MVTGRNARLWVALAALAVLPGCFALDEEPALRDEVAQWVFLAQTRGFTSRRTCTAASFDVISDQLRVTGGPVRVTSVREGVQALKAGRAVAFDLPGRSPAEISEEVSSLDLPQGLGLISSVVGPSRSCIAKVFATDLHRVLMSPDTLMVYDPGGNAVLFLYRPMPVVFFLRGNV